MSQELQVEYRRLHTTCEVSPFLFGTKWDSLRRANQHANWLELHHIMGRGKDCEDWRNYLMISHLAHVFIHDHDPNLGRLACLYAKCRKQKWAGNFQNTEFDPAYPPLAGVPGWIDIHYDDWSDEAQRMARILLKEFSQ